jgi:hypothetical protein
MTSSAGEEYAWLVRQSSPEQVTAQRPWLAALLMALGSFLLAVVSLAVGALVTRSSSEQSPGPSHEEGATTGQIAPQDPDTRRWLTPLLTALGGFLVAVIPVVGLIVSPWFQEHWDPPSKSVSLGAVCIQSGVTRGSFYSGYQEKVPDPNLEGLEVTVALTANGFDGGDIYMRSNVLNAVSGVEALGSLQGMAELRQVPINAPTVMRDPQIWVPLPTTTGQYVVQVRVMDGDLPSGNQGLAGAYSPLFTARSGGHVTLSGLCTGADKYFAQELLPLVNRAACSAW